METTHPIHTYYHFSTGRNGNISPNNNAKGHSVASCLQTLHPGYDSERNGTESWRRVYIEMAMGNGSRE